MLGLLSALVISIILEMPPGCGSHLIATSCRRDCSKYFAENIFLLSVERVFIHFLIGVLRSSGIEKAVKPFASD
jgi:hypothetical protein